MKKFYSFLKNWYVAFMGHTPKYARIVRNICALLATAIASGVAFVSGSLNMPIDGKWGVFLKYSGFFLSAMVVIATSFQDKSTDKASDNKESDNINISGTGLISGDINIGKSTMHYGFGITAEESKDESK